jgi:nicotinamidase/pyrazinamidase
MTEEFQAKALAGELGPRVGVVVVDVQNDFADPTGALAVPGAEEIIEPINALVDAATSSGASVFYTQDWHPSRTPHFDNEGGPWPVHCVAGSWGAELHPRLRLAGPVVRKGTGMEDGYSGFTVRDLEAGEDKPTELDAELRTRGVDRLIVVGLALDVCVKATALDAARLGYRTGVLISCSRPIAAEPAEVARVVDEMVAAGVEARY